MFGFSKIDQGPAGRPEDGERWFASHPPGDPLAVHAELMSALGAIADRGRARTPAHLAAVFRADLVATGLRESLTAQYIEHANRSSRIEHQLWSALFDLSQAFLQSYAAFMQDVGEHAQSNKWQAMLPELIERQMVHLGHEAKIRLYRYEQWIPAKWAELHTLFSLACCAPDRAPVRWPRARTRPSTIEHAYLEVLVLQLMNSGNLTARHLEWVANELDEWCSPLRLTLEASSVTSFYVDLGSREGLRRRTPAPLEGRVLFLDTRPLHAMLTQNIVTIEQKIRHQPLSEKTPRRNEQLGLLTKLASQVDPEYRPFARRGERQAAVGVVDAIVGFSRISGFLREEERDPLPMVDTGTSYGGTMELAVFGRVRNEDDRRRDLARRRLLNWAPTGGPWDIKDISQTGFRLIAPMSAAGAVTLNTLAAIRPHGQTSWAIGHRAADEAAHVGARRDRPAGHREHAGVVDLFEQKRGNADYSVDGEPTTLNGRAFHGLFLALRKREGDTAVQSLIVPAAEYQPTRRFRLATTKTSTPVRFGRLIEQQGEWVWAAVEPLELADDAMTGRTTIAGSG